MEPEFKKFEEIKYLKKLEMSITQKLHGTNACIYIFETENGNLDLVCGSRTRWIYPHSDNYGFASFVHENKQDFIDKLGPGRHYGEWVGPGINSGEGLKEKCFVLFNWRKWQGKSLPPRTSVVPVLYHGHVSADAINEVMEDLKNNGSALSPGFMKPEGVVVSIGGKFYKKVFLPEETQWTKSAGNKGKNSKKRVDFTYLCQPIRLEKLLSRDEAYVREYPESLPLIVKDYMADLVKEDQIPGTTDEIKAIRKAATSQIFRFIKTWIDDNNRA